MTELGRIGPCTTALDALRIDPVREQAGELDGHSWGELWSGPFDVPAEDWRRLAPVLLV